MNAFSNSRSRLGQMLVIGVDPGSSDLSIPSAIAWSGAVAMIVMDGNNAICC